MEENHDALIRAVGKEYQDILANSEQAIYIYLDDSHKICNKKFATLLGYDSEDEWAKIDASFPDAFVADESQETLVTSFQDAMEKNVASTTTIVWKKKDSSTISSTVILVPISCNGHQFALHFVSS
ncbi:MAG: hypothetical protein RLZZ455_679 [Candidatus Parcubacteria bacterium]|jgi:PAS domain-containing protein